jgi:protein SCO1/2
MKRPAAWFGSAGKSGKRLASAGGFLLLAAVPGASATGPNPVQAGDAGPAPAAHHVAVADKVVRSTARYEIPHVRLTRSDGKSVWFGDELDDGRPVVVDFIYTTCTSICPLSSQTFSALQERLGAAREDVHLLSISIDPESDTPRRLAEYSRRFDAGSTWQFYTGTLEASLAVQRAFHAYRGDKMSHGPLTLFRRSPGDAWARFDGFATVNDLEREIHGSLATR